MSILSKAGAWMRRVFSRARAGYTDPRDFARVTPYSYAGVHVTPDIALQVSAVWACVDVISKAIAGSDWNIYQRLRNGDRELLPNDPLSWLMNTRPNYDMTAMAMREALTAQALLAGNGYGEIEYDSRGRVTAIWPLWFEDVEILRDYDTGDLVYDITDRYRYGGQKRRLEAWQVFHLRGSSLCGWIGEGIAIRGANTISLAIAQERFAATFFGNGTNIGGTLKVDGVMGQEQRLEVRDEFEAAYRGATKAHRPLVLEKGWEYSPFSPDATKAQMTEARQHSIEEIARWFGVPPHKIGHLLRSTNNNIEHQGIEFHRETLRPWARRWEQEADYKLFPTRGMNRFVLIDLEWASQGDFKSRMEGYQIGRRIGVLSANDVLRAERKNTIGPEGDTRMVEMNMQPLDRLGQKAEETQRPTAPPEPPDDALTMSIRTFASSVYDRAARRRMSYESQMGGRPNAAALEKRAQFLESQKSVLSRDLKPLVSLVAKTWLYADESAIQQAAVSCAEPLFDAGGTIEPEEWAARFVALYRKV